MKHALILCLFACFYGIYAEDETRLIRFNETYAKWMTPKEIDELVAECAAKNGHTGFIDVTDYDFELIPQKPVTIPVNPRQQAIVNPLLTQIQINNIWQTITTLSSYRTRFYTTQTGRDAVTWLESRYKAIGGSRVGQDIEVTLFEHSWLQPSLIVRIRGTKNPTEKVIIGGHIDSTVGTSNPNGISPGADDDASGSSTVLEIYRTLVNDPRGFRPERTIEFHAYAAEEIGLRGSAEIAQKYSADRATVVGMFQLDMTGYDGSGLIGIVTDYTTNALTQFLSRCAAVYATIGYANTACGYGCSDHASWYNRGFPAAFAFESRFQNSNPDIHTSRDTIDKLDRDHAVQFARLGLGFVVEMSYLE